MAIARMLSVGVSDGRWRLVGARADRFVMVDAFLGYLVDRNYSPRTVRAYAFDLLAFCRWLDSEGIDMSLVDTDVLLRFLTHCRTATHPGRPGGNVYSILDGRNAGYAPATINRRLAAISALFAFGQMRDPAALNPVPRGREARRAARGSAAACWGMWASPGRGPGFGCVNPGGCPAAWTVRRRRRCWGASARGGTGPSPG